MKNVMSMKKTIIVALATIFSAVLVNAAPATETTGEPHGVVVRYLGIIGKNPVFEISINNPELDNYVVRIRDGNGTVIFSEKLIGNNMSRRYRIDTEEELSENALWFEVRAAKTKKMDVYVAGTKEEIDVKRAVAVNKLK